MGKDEDSEKEEVTPKIISKIPLTSTLLRLWFIVSNARFLTRVRLQTMIPLSEETFKCSSDPCTSLYHCTDVTALYGPIYFSDSSPSSLAPWRQAVWLFGRESLGPSTCGVYNKPLINTWVMNWKNIMASFAKYLRGFNMEKWQGGKQMFMRSSVDEVPSNH